MDNKMSVFLPKKIVEEFNLKNEDKLTLHIREQKIIMEPLNKKMSNQTLSLRWFLIPTIIISLFFSCIYHIMILDKSL